MTVDFFGRVSRVLAYCALSALAVPAAYASGNYSAEIRTTSYGIPHIKADDWGSLGYGYGYAFAGDNLCILAREVVAANGEESRYFGESSGRLTNDFFYTLVNKESFILGALADISPDAREGIQGFAAGYNRYLAETGVNNLPAECNGETWVRPIDEIDLARVYYKLILRASGGPLSSLIVGARPPAAARQGVSDDLQKQIDSADFSRINSLINRQNLGSNMVALGSAATASGKGMLLGNPHFPWSGPLRWYEVHLTIPGELDVMGASLQGVPLVNIGFKENFAWSHTVSPADRFALFEVPLDANNPLQYTYDGQTLDMESETVQIQVLVNGQLETRSHTFYRTVHGLVLDFQPLFGFYFWDTGLSVFALGDANAGSLRAIDQFFLMNTATDLTDFIDKIKTTVGLPWVHTTAASDDGTAFFGDISVMPNITAAKITACPPLFFGQSIIDQAGLSVLNGGSTGCRFDNDPMAPADGIIAGASLPSLTNNTYVTNSNDNHWLANPDTPLTGFQPPAQAEGTARSLRTRFGLKMVAERIAGTDGLGAPLYTLSALQDTLFNSRNYAAEMLVDDLVQVCIDEGETVMIDGSPVDLTAACTQLGAWDKQHNVDSFGPHIFKEFLESANDDLQDNLLSALFEVPFDINDPVNTPRDLADTDPADRANIMQWLGRGVERLNDNGIAMNAMWGDIQYDTKNGVDYPIHGGADGSGMFSIITANLGPTGYTPINHGNSYMQTVTFDNDGPVAEALLSYSQSSDPANANYADQTALYSTKQWVSLPFDEADILADPNYTTVTISEEKDTDGDGVGDLTDNCTEAANASQLDTDADGFGNFCDGDFNNDNIVNLIDLIQFKAAFGGAGPHEDLTGDGNVNLLDLVRFKQLFGLPPGPAAPQSSAVSYATDIQPFLAQKCAPCHTGAAVSPFNFAGNYLSTLEAAQTMDCPGQLAGECALTRVLSGVMPFNGNCSGDPVLDAGNAACLTSEELTKLSDWVSGGLLP